MNERGRRLAFGGAAISGEGRGYGFGPISEAESVRLLHAALDSGIRVFDTAPVYGFGTAERRMGLAFRDRRDRVFFVSKGGVTWDSHRRIRVDNRPEVLIAMLEQSLRDLQVETIDAYLLHWPDPRASLEEALAVLGKAKQQGKIRMIGLSNFGPDEAKRACGLEEVELLQNEFNLFKPEAGEALFPLVQERQMKLMTWGTLDKGILSGRVTAQRRFAPEDARSWAPWWKKQDLGPRLRAVDRLRILLADQFSLLDLALGFVLSHPEVTWATCGIRSEEQLASLLRAEERTPPPSLVAEARRIVKEELGSGAEER